MVAIHSFRRGLTTAILQKTPVAVRAKEAIGRMDAVDPFLVDSFKRSHNYLRISLTEKCNLRCFYCMPSEGIELSPSENMLTNSEIIRLATLFVKSGVTKIRLTGGEPTVRKGLSEIIESLNELRQYGLQSIAMTSNGISLHRRLPELVKNGLTHLNLSLDTLDPFKFELMTRRRGHEAVLKALDVALSTPGLETVKMNMVVVKGLNDGEVTDFVELTKDRKLSVRFIEFMPFSGNKWNSDKMVPSADLLSSIKTAHPGVLRAEDELNDTARSYYLPNYKGSFGFISSMSDHFCSSCNRLRITADGEIKESSYLALQLHIVCLFDAKEISLRDEMRRGVSDAELTRTIGHAVFGKQEKHLPMDDIDVLTNRSMIRIGATVSLNHRPSRKSPVWNHLPIPSTPIFMHGSFCEHTPNSFSDLKETTARFISTLPRLTHIGEDGRPAMVNVSSKTPTNRTATASGRISIPPIAYQLITGALSSSSNPAVAKAKSKGDVLAVAQLAAIMGCKRTSDLIPLCHPLPITGITVDLRPEVESGEKYSIVCTATVSCDGKTGVEMEALTAVSVGLLTVWDMLKAVAGKEMTIEHIVVTHKSGGKSGDFDRDTESE